MKYSPTQPTNLDSERPARLGKPLDSTRVLNALWRGRKFLFALAFMGATLSFLMGKLWFKPLFHSEFILRADPLEPLPSVPTASNSALAELEQAFVSRAVLGKLRKAFGLSDSVQALRKRIETSTNQRTGTVAVSSSADSAATAQALAEALWKLGRNHLSGSRDDQIRKALKRMDERIAAQGKRFAEVGSRYSALLRSHDIAPVVDESGVSPTSLPQLLAQQHQTKAEVRTLQARIRALTKTAESAPTMEVASRSVSNPAAQALASLEAELSSARASLSEEHPRVRALALRVEGLRGQVRSGKGQAVSSATMQRNPIATGLQASLVQAKGDLEAARERLSSVDALLQNSQKKPQKYSAVEGKAVELRTESQAAEAQLGELQQQRARLTTALERPELGTTLLTAPELPTQPKGRSENGKFLMLMPVGLALFGMLWLLGRELWGLRVMTPGELAYWGGGPVLASSQWPDEPTALDELIADFDDFAPQTPCHTLLVAATESISFEAQWLAQRLHDAWFKQNHLAQKEQSPLSSGVRTLQAIPHQLAAGDGPRPSSNVLLSVTHTVNDAGPSAHPLARPGGEHLTTPNPAHLGHRAPSGTVDIWRSEPGNVRAWEGDMRGHGLRRAARLAHRVVIVVEADTQTPVDLHRLRQVISRDEGVGFVLLGASESVTQGCDRVGPAEEFWQISTEEFSERYTG